jgi:predicted transcriptional regulator
VTSIDQYKDAILEARSQGASKAAIARALGFSRSGVSEAIDRWERPSRPTPGEDALEKLRALVEQ